MRVVIVGGGVGGLACAQRLAKRSTGLEITLIDSRLRHDFAASFLWVMTGARQPERISRPLSRLARSGVRLREAEVTGVDLDAGSLATSDGELGFDELVLAPGARLAPETIPGLTDAAHGFYVREAAERLRDALAAFAGGRVLVVVAAMPFKCPAAPYEAAFLIEDLAESRRLRPRPSRGRRRQPRGKRRTETGAGKLRRTRRLLSRDRCRPRGLRQRRLLRDPGPRRAHAQARPPLALGQGALRATLAGTAAMSDPLSPARAR